jgi:hypothetical protein
MLLATHEVPSSVHRSVHGSGGSGSGGAIEEADEIAHVAPVLLGDGVRLYDVPGGAQVCLERTALVESGNVVDLRFRAPR